MKKILAALLAASAISLCSALPLSIHANYSDSPIFDSMEWSGTSSDSIYEVIEENEQNQDNLAAAAIQNPLSTLHKLLNDQQSKINEEQKKDQSKDPAKEITGTSKDKTSRDETKDQTEIDSSKEPKNNSESKMNDSSSVNSSNSKTEPQEKEDSAADSLSDPAKNQTSEKSDENNHTVQSDPSQNDSASISEQSDTEDESSKADQNNASLNQNAEQLSNEISNQSSADIQSDPEIIVDDSDNTAYSVNDSTNDITERTSNAADSSESAHVHTVNTGFISCELSKPYTAAFLEDIRNGNSKLYYNGDSTNAEQSLSEVVSFYCSLPSGVNYYEVSDASGTYLELEPDVLASLQSAVSTADAGWTSYSTEVANACYSLNLNTTDTDLVNQINNYICTHFDYAVTNSGMPVFISTHQGQCWHYAKMFSDMCNAVGIQAWKVQTADHAWDQVVVDGIT